MPRGASPGERRGGRAKGTPNKVTAAKRAELAATGELPIDYMLRVMRDPTIESQRRDHMAVAAAPFLHPKLSAVDHSGAVDIGVSELMKALDGATRGLPKRG